VERERIERSEAREIGRDEGESEVSMSRDGRQWPVTHHDVLGGRGVSISQHAGNERFRALVFSRADADYCSTYTTEEKRAVAEEIVDHINSLDPPGRFLKRPKGYGGSSRSASATSLTGPWEEISRTEAIKKTCQALRDCNRRDRTGYGVSVVAKILPPDVAEVWQSHAESGMTKKQLAEQAAETSKRKAEETLALTQEEQQQQQQQEIAFNSGLATTMADLLAPPPPPPPMLLQRPHEDRSHPPGVASFAQSLMSMDRSSSVMQASPPHKKQRLLRMPEVTPATLYSAAAAATTGVARMHSSPERDRSSSMTFEDSSPVLPGFVLASTFDNDAKPRASSFDMDGKPRASSFDDNERPRAAGGAFLGDDIGEDDVYRALSDHDFGPHSPTYDGGPSLNDFEDET
jgi:hypothetical protein